MPLTLQRFGEQGRYSVRDQVDTPGFVQGGSSTRQEVRRLSPLRGPASSQASAVLRAPPQRDSPVMASPGSTARSQAPQASSSDRKERTTQAVPPSPRRTCPTVTVSGPTGPPTPPVALSRVLNQDSEEPVYRSSEDELQHRKRDGSPHSHRSDERDPSAMDVDEESAVGRDRRLTLTEVKAWSFSELEGLTRPSLSGGLVKPSLSQLASRVSVEPHPAFDKFPFKQRWHCWRRIGCSKAWISWSQRKMFLLGPHL